MPVKFPCISCKCPVKVNQRSIFCDVCDNWIHLKCTSLSYDNYHILSSSNDPWIGHVCLSMSLPFNSLDSSDFQSVIDDMNGPPNSHPCTIPNLNDFVSSNFPNLTNFRVDPNDPQPVTNNCLYSTDLDFVNNVHNYGSKLTLIHFNIRSLSKHFERLKDILHSLCEFSLIAISETWLKYFS